MKKQLNIIYKPIYITGELIWPALDEPRAFSRPGELPDKDEPLRYKATIILDKKKDQKDIELIKNTYIHILEKQKLRDFEGNVNETIARKLKDGNFYKNYDFKDIPEDKRETMRQDHIRLFNSFYITFFSKYKPIMLKKEKGKLIDITNIPGALQKRDIVRVIAQPAFSKKAQKAVLYLDTIILVKKIAISYEDFIQEKRIKEAENISSDIPNIENTFDSNKNEERLRNQFEKKYNKEKYDDEVPF